MTRSIIQWLALALLSIVADIANLFLAPIAVLFARDGWLPRWLSWLQTPDNSLDGDNGWRTKHLLALNPHGDRFDPLRQYLKRVAWLYRNGMYGFGIDVLGARCEAGDALLAVGDKRTSNQPGHSGYVRYVLFRNCRPVYWQLYYVRRWGMSNRCLRINLGWKLWGFRGEAVTLQHCYGINPFMAFEVHSTGAFLG